MSKKNPDKCAACGLKTTELFIYVDGNNGSITKHSPWLCKSCYVKRYGR